MNERTSRSKYKIDGIPYTRLCKFLRVAPSTLTREAISRGFDVQFNDDHKIPLDEAVKVRIFVNDLRIKGVIPQAGRRLKYIKT